MICFSFLAVAFLSACSSIPKDHVGIIFKKNEKAFEIKHAGVTLSPTDEENELMIINLNRKDTVDLKFLTKHGKEMSYLLAFDYQIIEENFEELVRFINTYNTDFKSTLQSVEHAEMRAASRSSLGLYTKQELESIHIDEVITAESYLPKFWKLNTVKLVKK
ncbi:hypothetical protein [Salibacter halophilus]|uniref:hypothetical protein n=1 Tax=Salibacter halophilus TaxID=1803916 RepID=UPI0014791AD5|nr:hypothetical protein [Salibacter halophilus]